MKSKSSAFGGLLVRRDRWGFSWYGWLILTALFFTATGSFLVNIHPFLALSTRAPAKVLIVEGWLHVPAVALAAQEFAAGGYDYIITTGGPMPETADNAAAPTWADSGAYWLRRAGVNAQAPSLGPIVGEGP